MSFFVAGEACCNWSNFSDYSGYVAFAQFGMVVLCLIAHLMTGKAAVQYLAVLTSCGLAGLVVYQWDQRRKCEGTELLCTQIQLG